MKAIRYRRSCEHTTVVNIGNKDRLIGSAITIAIRRYKEDFKQLCKQFYKEGNKNPAIETAIKEYKHDIRAYIDIHNALGNPTITSSREEAKVLATELF